MSKRKKEARNTDLSRRNFMKKLSSLAIGTAAVGMIPGCEGDTNVEIRPYSSADNGAISNVPDAWNDSADIIIVGFGGAAAMAAIHATQTAPGTTVLIVEAQGSGGGCTAMCGGGTHLGGGTQLQTDSGFSETAEEFYNYALATAGEGADSDLIKAYADNAKDTYDALVSIGISYDGYDSGYLFLPPDGKSLIYDNARRPEILEAAGLSQAVPHMHFGLAQGGAGRAATMWNALETATLGISTVNACYNTEVKQLIVDGNGRVVGVAAERDGETLYFKGSQAVLLANGGFIKNDEMVEQFIPHAMECVRLGNAMDLGTGIQMGQAIGADVKLMDAAEDWGPAWRSSPALVKAIAVNNHGERFAPEDLGGPEMGRWIARIYPLSYIVFDQTIMDEIDATIQPYLNADSADAIEELAALIDVPAAYLRNTIDMYNASAATGVDDQFRKDPNMVQEINTSPFYALTRRPTDVYTLSCGGLRINTKTQVLRPDGTVIPGLYAAGATTAHINAQYYLAGGGTAGAFVFGRIAGLEMVNEASWDV